MIGSRLRDAIAVGRSAAGWAFARSRFAIVMYHRIATSRDELCPGVTVRSLARQLLFLKRHCAVLALDEALDLASRGKRLPRRAVCITFDDGYRSTYAHAFPILARLGLPATVFVTTGAIDGGGRGPLWFDGLAPLVRGLRGPSLRVAVGGVPHRFATGTAAERVRAYVSLRELLKSVPDRDRLEALSALAAAAAGPEPPSAAAASPASQAADGAGEGEDRPMMTWDEVRTLSRNGIEIGAHTVNHPVQSRLPRSEAAREIVGSKSRIEEALGRAVRHFAYPNGRREDFGPEHKAIVAEAGFRSACSTIRGHNDRDTDPFALRRIFVAEGSMASFVGRLTAWERGHGGGG